MTGIAFHPNFNLPGQFGYGKLYTYTTEPRTDTSDGPQLNNVDFSFSTTVLENHQDVIREWDLAALATCRATPPTTCLMARSASSREIMRVDQPGPYHNIADLTFNPLAQPGDADYGLLYITAGDGGDQSGETHTSTIRRMPAQTLDNIYGKVLRIDPDPNRQAIQRTSVRTGLPSYSVPTTNPLRLMTQRDDALPRRSQKSTATVAAASGGSEFRSLDGRPLGK